MIPPRRLLHGNLPEREPEEKSNHGQIMRGTVAWATVFILCIIFWVAIFIFFMPKAAHADEGELIVKIAQSQIGQGEQEGDNEGSQVYRYTGGKRIAWCASFVSWVLREAGAQREIYLFSARSYWTKYKTHRVLNPKPGDLICFYRGSRGGHAGHVGIIESIRGREITTIEGNVGRYPAKVKEFHYQISHIPHLLGFVRIQ